MEKSYDLKPCPFCGAKAAVISNVCDDELCRHFEDDKCPYYEPEGEYKDRSGTICPQYIVCACNKGGCGAATGWATDVDRLVWMWNRRVV